MSKDTQNKEPKGYCKKHNKVFKNDECCPYCDGTTVLEILSKEKIREILGEKAVIDYERNSSHYHCWNQSQPSACGQSLESHTQCCLCDTPLHQDWEKIKTMLYEMDEMEFSANRNVLFNDVDRLIATQLYEKIKKIKNINADGGGNGRRIKEAVLLILKE